MSLNHPVTVFARAQRDYDVAADRLAKAMRNGEKLTDHIRNALLKALDRSAFQIAELRGLIAIDPDAATQSRRLGSASDGMRTTPMRKQTKP